LNGSPPLKEFPTVFNSKRLILHGDGWGRLVWPTVPGGLGSHRAEIFRKVAMRASFCSRFGEARERTHDTDDTGLRPRPALSSKHQHVDLTDTELSWVAQSSSRSRVSVMMDCKQWEWWMCRRAGPHGRCQRRGMAGRVMGRFVVMVRVVGVMCSCK
jgi:hypothetical protein